MHTLRERIQSFLTSTFWFIVVVPLVVLAILGLLWGRDVVMMAYHMRVPIIASVLLILLPIVAFSIPSIKQLLGNLFVLADAIQVASVVVATFVYANAVLLIFEILWQTGPLRFGYENPAAFEGWYSFFDNIPLMATYEFYVFSLLLAFPVLLVVLMKTSKEYNSIKGCKHIHVNNPRIWRGLLFGLMSLVVLVSVSNLAFGYILNFAREHTLQQKILNSELLEWCNCVIGFEGIYARLHLRAISFLLVGIVFYLLVGAANHPTPGFVGRFLRGIMKNTIGRMVHTPGSHRMHAAALFYVLLLLTSLTLILGALAYLFDYVDIPVILTLAAFSFCMSWIWKTKNRYSVQFREPYAPGNDEVLCSLIQKRLSWQDDPEQDTGKGKTLVIMCLKGGGIHSAGWAVRVLTGLQEREELGDTFTRSIALLSGVSGGAVGAMHYINHLGMDGCMAGNTTQIFDDATADSLDAASWGILYLDFWRLVGLPFLIYPERDRGWAIEQDWKAVMNERSNTTLSDLYARVEQGEIPIPVFNATAAADGGPVLFSPVHLPIKPIVHGATEKNFITRLTNKDKPGLQADIDITTAARLSAAFPYVSPISCNNAGDQQIYLADGGYFDNFGLFAGINFVEWLKYSDHAEHTNVDKVLLVSVRAFPEDDTTDRARSNWMHSVTGPINIMMAGRGTTQAEHLGKEVDLLQNLLNRSENGRSIDFRTVNIEYPELESWAASGQPPLSWKLSPGEKKNIMDAWEADSVTASVDEIVEIWKAWGMGSCPDPFKA